MKKHFVIFLFLFLSAGLFAQVVPGAIVHAFEKGESKKLLPYFNDNLEINILNNKHTTSRNQAVRILQDFFDKHPPRSFNVDSEEYKKDSKFGIGTLHTEKGNFRVNIKFLEKKKQKIIYYLSIEKI